MNKTAIKNFAIWARNKLIADIVYQAGLLGITEKGIATALPQSTSEVQFFDIGTKDYMTVRGKSIRQRDAFVAAIKAKQADTDFASAFRFVVEKVAYTWFNRLVAIRFMEVNDYLPGRVRVLSSENAGKAEPDMVTRPFDTDLSFTAQEQDEIMRMKDENRLDELFRMLFIKQCQKLSEVLPGLFDPQGIDRNDSYLELLLTISFTDKDGVLWHLIHDIPEDDFNMEKEGQVEIIGWMYQYYNTEPKDQVFANLKKNIKISKDNIPAATQLFTPDWIVRYMVENSLGRLWVEGHPNEELKKNWKYYLEDAEQEPEVQAQLAEIRKQYAELRPEDLKAIDPCMGSGHILVYLFDVLMQIYESQGWTQREAAQSIVQNNLFGLDIDDRAAQLAYFAVMMKARQYDRRFLERGIVPHVYGIQESNGINREQIKLFGKGMSTLEKNNAINQLNEMLDALRDAKEYGSILDVPELDWDLLRRYTEDIDDSVEITLDTVGADETLKTVRALVEQAMAMAQKYHSVTTNPPYMGASGMGSHLIQYIKDYFPDSKNDLFAVFIERCKDMTKHNCYQAMITQHAWMFLSSYERLRITLEDVCVVNMAHLGPHAFEEIGGEVVQTTAFVLLNEDYKDYQGTFVRLVDQPTQYAKEDMFLSGKSRYITKGRNYSVIPGKPVAYWASDAVLNAYKRGVRLDEVAQPKQGIKTADKDRFLRVWHEIGVDSFSAFAGTMAKWFPCNKGGAFRKWYGNCEYVVNWQNNGYEICNFRDENGKLKSRPQNLQYMLREGLTYTNIGSSSFGIRYSPAGFIYDAAGSGIFCENRDQLMYVLAFLASVVSSSITRITSPTMSFEVGQISTIPFIYKPDKIIDELARENISLCKNDWDSFETSWDFQTHYLIRGHSRIEKCFDEWKKECEDRIQRVKNNEEEINRRFISIYSMENELSPDVDLSDITITSANLGRDIRSLISYAVGCMFGRFSLDTKGIVYAGGTWNPTMYRTFIPDLDNCIPITDEAYLEDDIVGRFVDFIRLVYGDDTLEENLSFIAAALGNKGNSSRETIRTYFLNDFYREHCATYTVTGSGKRPIYWLFDSGKNNGFKALVYMHRWNADTVGNLRVEYLHRMQHVYEREIERMQDIIDNSRDNHEVNQASKRREKLVKQLKETRDYDTKIAHAALSRVEIDLDDGVKINYEKVQKGPDGKSLGILAKI